MKHRAPALLSLAVVLIAPSARSQLPSSLAGCYGVTRSEWKPSLGLDSVGHRIPPVVRLDTVSAGSGIGWVLGPNISYQSRRPFPGLPRWSMDGTTLVLLWSNGYTPTRVTLRRIEGRESVAWSGEAVALTDDHPLLEPPRPRATILLRPQPCARGAGNRAPGI